MNLTRTLAALAFLALGASTSLLVGCPAEAECVADETQCDDEMIQVCTADGTWGAPEECSEAGEACMTMDSGLEHCMDGGAM